MKKAFAWMLVAICSAACMDASPFTPLVGSDPIAAVSGATAFVTNANDAGEGSFRAAIAEANGDPAIRNIEFRPGIGTIALASGILFTGLQDLSIDGKRAVIDGSSAGGTAIKATAGGDFKVSNLTVRDAPGEGIAVEVPAGASGTLTVELRNVDITGNRGHGVLVNDQVDPSTQDGVQPNPAGSDVSIVVIAHQSRFAGNGYSVSDRDGLRVNEGGNGSLTLRLTHVRAENNAADGVEIDERGQGDVVIHVVGSQFEGNGQFDPEDLDDGFDVDEMNDGSILGSLVQSSANNNYEEGLDFNENNPGDLRVDLVQVEASGNREEGIDYEEDDDFAGGGDLVTVMQGITANGNGADGGDAGLKIREKGAGELDVRATGVETSNNEVGGISIREDAQGSLAAVLWNVLSLSNAGHGIDFDENRVNTSDPGDLVASVSSSTSSNNTGAGVRADQQTPGAGSLLLTNVVLSGNGGGATTGSNVTITIVH